MNSDPSQMYGFLAAMVAIYLVVFVVAVVAVIIPFWFILKKAGFSPWLSLVNIAPLGSLVLLYILAFAQWKVAPVQGLLQPPVYPPYPPQPPLPPQA